MSGVSTATSASRIFGPLFARHADDFIILVKGQRAGERVFAGIRRFLERQLKLVVNEQESKVASLSACTFLGFCFVRGKPRWSEAAFGEFKRRLRVNVRAASDRPRADARIIVSPFTKERAR